MHCDAIHNVHAHYGVRSKTAKLIYYYNEDFGLPGTNPGGGEPEWELFDLSADANELNNIYGQPEAAALQTSMLAELDAWQDRIADPGVH
jgi:hypothetical protein